jgi:hypothetical protein
MDEVFKGFFWIPDFRHVILQALRLSLYVSKSGLQICTARKCARKRACGGGSSHTVKTIVFIRNLSGRTRVYEYAPPKY